MADGSRRLNLNERIHVIKNYYLGGQSYKYVADGWAETFQSHPPSKQAMSNLVTKFNQQGSVADAPRSGAPKTQTNEENTQLVAQTFVQSPTKSQRRASMEMGISRRSLGRIMDDLGLKPYRPHLLQALNEDDSDRRLQYCEVYLEYAKGDPDIFNKVIYSDEATFKLNGRVNRHNCVYWSATNPHQIIENEVNMPGLTVWAGLCSDGLIGPFFFQGTVKSQNYLTMLKEEFIPNASKFIDLDQYYFQQDGAPPHYGLIVREWLDTTFPGRWVGRRGPIEWPARSPDLSPLDFFLWGVIKDKVYAVKSRSLEELRNRIRNAFNIITPDLCLKVANSVERRLQDCVSVNGGHFEHLQ
jgi:transposase